jgi:hypothetical protein
VPRRARLRRVVRRIDAERRMDHVRAEGGAEPLKPRQPCVCVRVRVRVCVCVSV